MTTTTLSPVRKSGLSPTALAPQKSGAPAHTSGLAAPKPARRPGEGGFTLVEVMISATLGAFLLAAVLSTFLFMGRSGANVQNYNDMEGQARSALEFFAEDTRQASSVTWGAADSNSVALIVGLNTITYTFSPTARTFSRVQTVTATGAVTSTRVLVTGITTFAFSAYNISGNSITLASATDRTTANGTTKQIQISLEAARANQTVVAATNTVLSARFILRNKRVTA